MSDLKMEATATDSMVNGLVARLERDGHYLTSAAVARIHAILSDCLPDRRAEGTQRELASLVRERAERDRP